MVLGFSCAAYERELQSMAEGTADPSDYCDNDCDNCTDWCDCPLYDEMMEEYQANNKLDAMKAGDWECA